MMLMKILEVIQEFMPCEVCGNSDTKNFYFHVFVHQGSQPYVKCCECEEEYYSTKARKGITEAEKKRKLNAKLPPEYNEIIESNQVEAILRGEFI